MKSHVFLILFYAVFTPLVSGAVELPNDQDLGMMPYIHQMHVPEAWAKTGGGSEHVTIAIVDTGVDITHPELRHAIWKNKNEIADNGIDDDGNGYVDDTHGWNFVEQNNTVRPKLSGSTFSAASHGTVIAGIIAAEANNVIGGAGIAHKAKIMPLVAINNSGVGVIPTVVSAIEYAIAEHADIINLSLTTDEYSPELDAVITKAADAGILVVVAAGNDQSGKEHARDLDMRPVYPACNDLGKTNRTVLSVGSVDQYDRLSEFSDYGSNCMDIVAPGDFIYGTTPYDPRQPPYDRPWYAGFAGTSMSVGMVSGVAGLLQSYDASLTATELRGFIVAGVDAIDAKNPKFAGKVGAGRVNARRSVRLLEQYAYHGTQYLDRTLARVVVSAHEPVSVEFATADGSSTTRVELPDIRRIRGWEVSIGYAGLAHDDARPVFALAPPAGGGDDILIYDWSGVLRDSVAIPDYRSGGVRAELMRMDGSGAWELIIAPRTGAGSVYRYSFETEQLTHIVNVNGDTHSVWSMAGWSSSSVLSARLAFVDTGRWSDTFGSVRIYDERGSETNAFRYPVKRGNATSVSIVMAYARMDGDMRPVAYVSPVRNARAYPFIRYDLRSGLKESFTVLPVTDSVRDGFYVRYKKSVNSDIPGVLFARASMYDPEIVLLDENNDILNAWTWDFSGRSDILSLHYAR